MARWLLAAGLVTALAIGTPRPAAADFAFSLGLPGFGLFVGDGPPVAYAPPPVVWVPPPPPVVWGPPVVYGPPVVVGGGYYPYYGRARYRGWGPPGRRVGWYKHGYGKHGHGPHGYGKHGYRH